MPRLTRSERQAQTRAELLQAAKARFLAMGYAATILEDIADDAGYSKGAVYSNFPDKPTLCGEVLALIHHEKLAEVQAVVSAGTSLGDRFSALAEWLDASLGDVGWTMLEFEFVVLSRNDPRLAQMIVELRGDAHRMIVDALRGTLDELGASSDGPGVDQLLSDAANFALSTGIGLSVQRAVDPTMAARPIGDMARDLLGSLAARAGDAGGELRELLPDALQLPPT